MAVTQLGEEFRIVAAGRLAGKVLTVAHLNGGRGVVIGHTTVLYEHTRHAVGRCGHNIVIIEAYVGEVFVQLSIPVLLGCFRSQSQVPFANGASGIASLLEGISHGVLRRTDNHAGVSGGHIGAFLAEGVFARQQGVA